MSPPDIFESVRESEPKLEHEDSEVIGWLFF